MLDEGVLSARVADAQPQPRHLIRAQPLQNRLESPMPPRTPPFPKPDGPEGQRGVVQHHQMPVRARLLGGTVVGSATDLSTVYYNPGLLALVDDSELILAGTVYQVTNIKVEDALGSGRDLTWGQAGGVPSLFAGEFKFGFLGNTRLAYSFLSRHAFDIRVRHP